MTGPVVRLVFSLRKQLKAAREANSRLLIHVARQDAQLAEVIARRDEALADLEAQNRTIRVLMESCPSTIEEVS